MPIRRPYNHEILNPLYVQYAPNDSFTRTFQCAVILFYIHFNKTIDNVLLSVVLRLIHCSLAAAASGNFYLYSCALDNLTPGSVLSVKAEETLSAKRKETTLLKPIAKAFSSHQATSLLQR